MTDSATVPKSLGADEWVMKATIPEAAGGAATVHVLPTSDSIPVDFNELGQLYSPSWQEPGVVLPVIPYGKLYKLVFNNPLIEDFYIVSIGYGGGVADISVLECFAYEHKFSRVRILSGSDPLAEIETETGGVADRNTRT